MLLLFTAAIAAVTIAFAAIGFFVSEKFEKTGSSSKKQDFAVVIIDAGHGGEDGGAQSADGISEKDINLAIAKYLKEYLALSDVNAVMTRTDDRLLYEPDQSAHKKFHDVRNRVKFAESYEDPIFVSIHQNKFPIEKYHGLQVYYSKHNSGSKELAEDIQENARIMLDPDNQRKAKVTGSSIYIMNNLDVPAVLVECGFLSNPSEAEKLTESEYQKKIAFVIFTSITRFASKNTEV